MPTILERYNLLTAYLDNQTDEQWEILLSRLVPQMFVFTAEMGTHICIVRPNQQAAQDALDEYIRTHSNMLGIDHWKLQQIAASYGNGMFGIVPMD